MFLNILSENLDLHYPIKIEETKYEEMSNIRSKIG